MTDRKAVVAVLLPREHLPFIREWCLHHLAQGWEIYLYDNTGSTGSTRLSSVFKIGTLQKSGTDKRGVNYFNYTKHLSDEDVSLKMRELLSDLDVTIITWHPTNDEGHIIHGQVEAYVDFIRHYKNEINWAAFIDADEYLSAGTGMSWDSLIARAQTSNHYRVMINGVVYESRWTQDGEPQPLSVLRCGGEQLTSDGYTGCKNIVRLDKVIAADIHWFWRIENENYTVAAADTAQYYFKHYKGKDANIKLNVRTYVTTGVRVESIDI